MDTPPQYGLGDYTRFGLLFLVSGLAGYLAKIQGDPKRFGWLALIAHLTASATAGTVTVLICIAVGISPAWSGALAGVAGYMGPQGLDAATRFLSWKFGLDLEKYK